MEKLCQEDRLCTPEQKIMCVVFHASYLLRQLRNALVGKDGFSDWKHLSSKD